MSNEVKFVIGRNGSVSEVFPKYFEADAED
jgi:dsDNA-binding SOS-regulon protein